ncbi:hypothetical protein BP6252_03846 [Coleophoma cylindrospora]|uniref:Uncharacterized protein n=1 Tax=Coleophoma cylindrospora TaxID=1849047 RepID=A0A3D8S9F3_9HELO|nr:hypothetical protein BP6252_03846 [Coleophoma cylindrospora]
MSDQSHIYFTAEEILSPLRCKITEWYREDHKTEEEIVALCLERRLSVSVAQIHNCLISWSVISSPHQYTALAAVNSPGMPYATELVTSPITNATPSADNEAGSARLERQDCDDEESCIIPRFYNPSSNLYTGPCPDTGAFPSHQGSDQTGPRQHVNYNEHEILERQRSFDSLPSGPSQLEIFTADFQPYEKLAVELEKDSVTQRHRRLAWYKRSASDARRRMKRTGKTTARLTRLERMLNRSVRTI